MRRYWQRKPLLVRQAIPGFVPSLSIADIRQLIRREEVESRLIWRDTKGWHMKNGPFARLPAASRPNWTALAQSVDLHDDATAALMQQFRFIADARLDDIMISIASEGGGVGPHFDSYDVFLLQGHGRRRWRISQQQDLSLEPGLPLKILSRFQAEEEYVLEPGDMLYLPPHVAHDGIALDDCMTISIGFRAPTQATLACGMLEAANDQIMAALGDAGGIYASPPLPGPALSATYKDPGEPATETPAALPQRLIDATLDSIRKIRFDESLATQFLGAFRARRRHTRTGKWPAAFRADNPGSLYTHDVSWPPAVHQWRGRNSACKRHPADTGRCPQPGLQRPPCAPAQGARA
jgi:50S ribosomal protein L16 3-hydroxylase